MMSSSCAHFDIVVLGGGLAGVAAAVTLAGPRARTRFRVALASADDPRRSASAAFDGRASAITLTSQRMLEAIGVWRSLAPDAEAMREVKVTDSHPGADRRPVLLQFGEAVLPPGPAAWMIENRFLHRALAQALEKGGIDLLAGVRATAAARERAATVTLDTGTRLEAPLVVAADGAGSPARIAAGIRTVGWGYGQCGLVTTVEHQRAHRGIAEEHFLPAGPFAILPLPGRRSSLVWTEPEAEARRIAALDEAGFARELERRFGAHLGAVEPIGPRHVYPLAMHIAESFVAPRLALIGDAAHVVHPLAGLGLNLALRDIAALAETVTEAARIGLDWGSAAVLERYPPWRRFDTVKVALLTDGLNRLFSNDHPALRALRDAGLAAVDRLEPLKAFFMREAAGVSGQLPKLLRGEPI